MPQTVSNYRPREHASGLRMTLVSPNVTISTVDCLVYLLTVGCDLRKLLAIMADIVRL